MRRALRVGFVVIVIISVAAILITPNLSDDVDGVLHQHHLHVLQPTLVYGSRGYDPIDHLPLSAANVNSSERNLAEWVDLFCACLC